MPNKARYLLLTTKRKFARGWKLLLTTEGYQVTMADTGQVRTFCAGERPLDLLLMDVSLPDRNGIEL